MKESLGREEMAAARSARSARSACSARSAVSRAAVSVRSGRSSQRPQQTPTVHRLLKEQQKLLKELHSVISAEEQLYSEAEMLSARSGRTTQSLHPSAWGSDVSSTVDGSLTARSDRSDLSTTSSFRSQMWGDGGGVPVRPSNVPALQMGRLYA